MLVISQLVLIAWFKFFFQLNSALAFKKGSCPLQMVLRVLLSSVRYYLDLSASLWTWGHQVSNLPLCISALLKFVLCLSVAVSLLLFVSILTMIVLHWNGSSRALSVNSSSPVCKTCQAPHFSEWMNTDTRCQTLYCYHFSHLDGMNSILSLETWSSLCTLRTFFNDIFIYLGHCFF